MKSLATLVCRWENNQNRISINHHNFGTSWPELKGINIFPVAGYFLAQTKNAVKDAQRRQRRL